MRTYFKNKTYLGDTGAPQSRIAITENKSYF